MTWHGHLARVAQFLLAELFFPELVLRIARAERKPRVMQGRLGRPGSDPHDQRAITSSLDFRLVPSHRSLMPNMVAIQGASRRLPVPHHRWTGVTINSSSQ